ncbi:hypothetical protein [Stenotrophomonas sp. PS02301]|uniref:hypothetical protein n=1 Tax=Stenotrophomonas sp. PS02301 TaxID=2991427 RepID=UPI00249C06D0|nr:hypothetical protein [Stenotrophomonas sp. PS02301]
MDRELDGYKLWSGSEKMGVAAKWVGTITVTNRAGEAYVHALDEAASDDPIAAANYADERLREVKAVGPDFEIEF